MQIHRLRRILRHIPCRSPSVVISHRKMSSIVEDYSTFNLPCFLRQVKQEAIALGPHPDPKDHLIDVVLGNEAAVSSNCPVWPLLPSPKTCIY